MALDVTLHDVVPDQREPGLFAVRASVGGGCGSLRLYVYLDGELVGAWQGTSDRYEFRAPDNRGPRSVVTVRAIDSTGRWGGTSCVIGTDSVEAAPGALPVPRGTSDAHRNVESHRGSASGPRYARLT